MIEVKPPAEYTTYIFDYSRSTGKMRFRLGENTWLVDRLAGSLGFDHTEKTGRWHVDCALVLKEGSEGVTAFVYPPSGKKITAPVSSGEVKLDPADNHDDCRVGTDHPFPQGRDTHWRLCFARELSGTDKPFWRLRDERTGELWFVHDYEGEPVINWFDHGSHVFVDGPATVDEKGIAHFA